MSGLSLANAEAGDKDDGSNNGGPNIIRNEASLAATSMGASPKTSASSSKQHPMKKTAQSRTNKAGVSKFTMHMVNTGVNSTVASQALSGMVDKSLGNT